MKKLIISIVFVAMALLLTACGQAQELPQAEKHACAFGEWETVIEPTCVSVGQKARYCSCGNSEYADVPFSAHTPTTVEGYAPTCETDGYTDGSYCAYCLYTLSEQQTIYATGHKYVGGDLTPPTCTDDGFITEVKCTVCDYVSESKVTISALGHDYRSLVVFPTCTSEGYTKYTCITCQHSYETDQAPKYSHNIARLDSITPSCITPGYTEGSYCTTCSTVIVPQTLINPIGHTAKIVPGTSATCDKSGLTEGSVCETCNVTLIEQVEIPKLTHNYLDTVIDASCEAGGYTEHRCSYCQDTYTDNYTDRLAHTETVIVGYPATCTTTGMTDGKYCIVCESITLEQSVISAKGHTEVSVVGKLPTCTEGGFTEKISCSACLEVLIEDVITAPLGHEYTASVISPTCTEGGYTVHTCVRCDDTYSDTFVASRGHNEVIIPYVAPSCTAPGSTEGSYCSYCGTVFTQTTEIAAIGHRERTLNAVDPTCQTTGLSAGIDCSVCGAIIEKQDVISKLDHVYTSETVAPTCTDNGYTYFRCSLCGNSYTDGIVDAIGHISQTIVGKNATCTETGLTDGEKCSVCNTVLKEHQTISMTDHTSVRVPGTPATCTASGLTDGEKCSVCNTVLKEHQTIAVIDHTSESVPGTPATCTASGLTDGEKCSVCNTVLREQQFIAMLGHTSVIVPGTPATCTGTGLTEGAYCSVCQITITEQSVIAANGHTEQIIPMIPATCNENGATEGKICSVCNTVLVSSEVISASGHNYVATVVPSSCTVQGYTVNECVCGDKFISDYVSTQGHSLSDWHFDEEKGRGVISCETCDYFYGVSSMTAEYIGTSHLFVGESVGTHLLRVTVTYDNSDREVQISSFEILDGVLDTPGTDIITVKFFEHEVAVSIPVFYASLPGTTPISYFTYTESKTGDITITGYTGPYTSVVIPASISRTKPVVAIAASAFKGNTSITSVSIPGSVKTVGNYAFQNCSALTEITLHEGITTIGYGAFMNTAVRQVTIPDSVTVMNSYYSTYYGAFEGCSQLTEVTIGASLAKITRESFYNCISLKKVTFTSTTVIDEYAFSGCTSLTDIVFAEGLTTLKESAFNGCTSLVSVTFPSTLTTIGASAFSGCSALKNIGFNEGLVEIGGSAFIDCVAIETITTPSTLQIVGHYAFQNCSGLVDLNLNEGLKTIDYGAFLNCDALVSVTIPDSVTVMNSYHSSYYGAFEGCKQLTEVTIGSSLAKITPESFYNCISLKKVTFTGTTVIDEYAFLGCTSLTDIVFAEGLTKLNEGAFKGCTALVDVTFPSTLTQIGVSAFSGCSALKNVGFNEGLVEIGGSAFYNCVAIESITTPSSLQIVGPYAFENCSGLVNLNLNEGLKTIDYGAFRNCDALVSVTIPDSVTVMNSYHSSYYGAFEGCSQLTEVTIGSSLAKITRESFYNCISLKKVTFTGTTVIDEYAFSGCTSLTDIIFAEGLTTLKESAFNGCTSLVDVTFPSTLTQIGVSAFSGCSALKNIGFNEGLVEICGSAFYNCVAIESITTPSSLQIVGPYAFQNCSGLVDLNLNEGLKTIDYGAFLNCDALISVTIPDSVTTMNSYHTSYYGAFADCTSLKSVVIGDSLAVINDYSFSGCTALESVVFGANVTTIKTYAFSNCHSLSSIDFGANLRTIGNYAFQNCRALETLALPSTVQTVGNYAFAGCDSLEIVTMPEVQTVGDYAFNNCEKLDTVTFSGKRLSKVGKGAFNNCKQLKRIYYGGNAEQWETVNINSNNSYPLDVTPYYYSEVQPVQDGNFWHYSNDKTELVWQISKEQYVADNYTREFATEICGSQNSYIAQYQQDLLTFGFAMEVSWWETAHIVTSPSHAFEGGYISRKDMYMTAIYEIIGLGEGEAPILVNMMLDETKTQYDQIIKYLKDQKIYDLNNLGTKKALKDFPLFDDIGDVIDACFTIAENGEEAINNIVKYQALVAVSEQFSSVLLSIANDTDLDRDLRDAAEEIARIMNTTCDDARQDIINNKLVFSTVEDFALQALDAVWKGVWSLIPGAGKAIDGIQGFRAVANSWGATDRDQMVQNYIMMDVTLKLQGAIRKTILESVSDPLRYENAEYASDMIKAGEMLKAAMLTGYDYAYAFAVARGDNDAKYDILWEKTTYENELNDYSKNVESTFNMYYEI